MGGETCLLLQLEGEEWADGWEEAADFGKERSASHLPPLPQLCPPEAISPADEHISVL